MVEGREEVEGHLGNLLLWSRSMVMVTRGRTEVVAFVRNRIWMYLEETCHADASDRMREKEKN